MQQSFLVKMAALFLTLFSLNGFAQTNEAQINHLIQNYMRAYEKRDAQAIGGLYASDAMAIGTGSDEILKGRKSIVEGFKRDFNESTNASVSAKKIAIDIHNNAALASYFVTVKVNIPDSTPFESTLRFTLGLLKENNQWHIVQSHLSAPLIEQKPGTSFPHTEKS